MSESPHRDEAAHSGAIRVVLADDSFLVREAVAAILTAAPSVELVASCGDRGSLLEAVERELPAVVVTDIRMPPGLYDEGIQIANELHARHPEIGVVVLSQYTEPSFGLALLEHGPQGRAYLLKEHVHDGGQLLNAIEAVAQGGAYIDATVVETMVRRGGERDGSPLAALSPRELEILGEIAQGKSNARIAEELVLTKRAVEKHINAIFLKLDLSYAHDVSRRVKATLIYLAATRERSG
jgi:DNA-binding NarL/FixJ family response regulator